MSVFSDKSLKELGLPQWLLDNCEAVGMTKATEIQATAIPAIQKGKDVMGRAKTGSGKTAAFALPILQELSEDPYGIFALILTPTRELACQIGDQFTVLCENTGFSTAIVYGGSGMITNTGQVEDRPNILISTPGRLADLLRGGMEFPVSDLRFLVLDECDQLLLNRQKGFVDDLKYIFDLLPLHTMTDGRRRQTLMFSATLDGRSIRQISEQFQSEAQQESPSSLANDDEDNDEDHSSLQSSQKNKARLIDESDLVVIETSKSKMESVTNILQCYAFIPEVTKESFLISMLKSPKFRDKCVIVFVSSKDYCSVLSQLLRKFRIKCAALHSGLKQVDRLKQLYSFRQGKSTILVCTDVASRGLDIAQCEIVVNFDVPGDSLAYIHRVGRCGRVDRHGLAVTLVSQFDVELFKKIEDIVIKKQVLPRLYQLHRSDMADGDNQSAKGAVLSEEKGGSSSSSSGSNIMSSELPILSKKQVKQKYLGTREAKNRTYAKYGRMDKFEQSDEIEADAAQILETVLIKRAQVINESESKYLMPENIDEIRKHPMLRKRQRGFIDPRMTGNPGEFAGSDNDNDDPKAKVKAKDASSKIPRKRAKRKRSQLEDDLNLIQRMSRINDDYDSNGDGQSDEDTHTAEAAADEFRMQLENERMNEIASIIGKHKRQRLNTLSKSDDSQQQKRIAKKYESSVRGDSKMFGWDTFRYGGANKEYHNLRRKQRVMERTKTMRKQEFDERMEQEKKRRKKAKRAARSMQSDEHGMEESKKKEEDSGESNQMSVRQIARAQAGESLFEIGHTIDADNAGMNGSKGGLKSKRIRYQNGKKKKNWKSQVPKRMMMNRKKKKSTVSKTVKKIYKGDSETLQKIERTKQDWFGSEDPWGTS